MTTKRCEECGEDQSGVPGFEWDAERQKHLCEGCREEPTS